MKGKQPKEQVFDKVDPGIVNEYFKEFMDDLSAKDSVSQDHLLKFYNDANRAVAILCNHQKAESKQHALAMEKLVGAKGKLEKEVKILKRQLAFLKDPASAKEVKAPPEMRLPKDAASCKKKLIDMVH